ncbi:putative kunitz-type protease inhibitor [Schistosoma mansoni]|uniref:Putative kunitz-type protease inhibitor n=1 Tax=Schistosoma mansoni TaxID=6183 RepID=G4VBB1_SCHMA|nr:putative kunitz-type protease inhibitor [Schistosoma mansoni]|eukprot:XP_018649809.1 putative kunitz-type protease inhibitor [Schistosoma mansoni]
MKKGYCLQNKPRFYYNPAENKCLPFSFSGCGGNENRFHTMEKCESFCKKTIVGTENKKPSTTPAGQRTNEPTTRIIYITKSSRRK